MLQLNLETLMPKNMPRPCCTSSSNGDRKEGLTLRPTVVIAFSQKIVLFGMFFLVGLSMSMYYKKNMSFRSEK